MKAAISKVVIKAGRLTTPEVSHIIGLLLNIPTGLTSVPCAAKTCLPFL